MGFWMHAAGRGGIEGGKAMREGMPDFHPVMTWLHGVPVPSSTLSSVEPPLHIPVFLPSGEGKEPHLIPYSLSRYVGDSALFSQCHAFPLSTLLWLNPIDCLVGGGLGSLGKVIVNEGHMEMEDEYRLAI